MHPPFFQNEKRNQTVTRSFPTKISCSHVFCAQHLSFSQKEQPFLATKQVILLMCQLRYIQPYVPQWISNYSFFLVRVLLLVFHVHPSNPNGFVQIHWLCSHRISSICLADVSRCQASTLALFRIHVAYSELFFCHILRGKRNLWNTSMWTSQQTIQSFLLLVSIMPALMMWLHGELISVLTRSFSCFFLGWWGVRSQMSLSVAAPKRQGTPQSPYC